MASFLLLLPKSGLIINVRSNGDAAGTERAIFSRERAGCIFGMRRPFGGRHRDLRALCLTCAGVCTEHEWRGLTLLGEYAG